MTERQKYLVIKVETESYNVNDIDGGMTVGELINKLNQFDPNAIASIEINDRYGSIHDTLYDGWNERNSFEEINN